LFVDSWSLGSLGHAIVDPNKIWSRCNKDCRLFQQKGIGIKQTEIDKLLKIGVADEIEKNVVIYENLAKGVAVVPVDPTKVLCISDAVLVTPSTRKLLEKRWKWMGNEEYCRLLSKELSYLSMHPIDDSDSEGSSNGKSDSNTDSEFNCPQRKTTFKSLVDHVPDWRFLEKNSLMSDDF